MKKTLNALTGKKAMVITLVTAIICLVLEVITSLRMGTKIDFAAMGMIFSAITIWASAIEIKEKKKEAR